MRNATQNINSHAFPYIINAIDADGYDTEPTTDTEKLQFLFDTFRNEYGWMIERVGHQTAFAEWCKGLPSAFNIEFTNWGIIELAKSWGSLAKDATERQCDKIVENYWQFIASKTFQLFKKHGITH